MKCPLCGFENPEALSICGSCGCALQVPVASPSAPRILDARGYKRSFYAGPAARPGNGALCSRSSMTSFAYVVVPTTPGKTGVRSFCGDDSSRVCMTTDGSAPRIVEGRCDPNCKLVQ